MFFKVREESVLANRSAWFSLMQIGQGSGHASLVAPCNSHQNPFKVDYILHTNGSSILLICGVICFILSNCLLEINFEVPVIFGSYLSYKAKLFSILREGDELHQRKPPFWAFKKEHSHHLKHFYTISSRGAYEKQMLNVVPCTKWYGK